jgi:hypothetical protein
MQDTKKQEPTPKEPTIAELQAENLQLKATVANLQTALNVANHVFGIIRAAIGPAPQP